MTPENRQPTFLEAMQQLAKAFNVSLETVLEAARDYLRRMEEEEERHAH